MAKPSIRNTVLNHNGPDPIQGYDVGVWIEDMGRTSQPKILLGQFTSIVITVKNASEPYIPVGSRQPIYLDGELQIGFSLEKGLVDTRVFQQTLGFRTLSNQNRYLRSPRFRITFAVDPVDWSVLDEASYQFGERIERYAAGRFVLERCKIDLFQVGAMGGKQVVATQWQGVAEALNAEPLTLADMPKASQDAYGEDGQPRDTSRVKTFFFQDFSDTATTQAVRWTLSSARQTSGARVNHFIASRAVGDNRPSPVAPESIGHPYDSAEALYDRLAKLRGELGLLTMGIALNPKIAARAAEVYAEMDAINKILDIRFPRPSQPEAWERERQTFTESPPAPRSRPTPEERQTYNSAPPVVESYAIPPATVNDVNTDSYAT